MGSYDQPKLNINDRISPHTDLCSGAHHLTEVSSSSPSLGAVDQGPQIDMLILIQQTHMICMLYLVLGMLLIQAHYCLEPAAILESPQLNRVKLLAVWMNYDSKGVYTTYIDVQNGW